MERLGQCQYQQMMRTITVIVMGVQELMDVVLAFIVVIVIIIMAIVMEVMIMVIVTNGH